jgi:NAD(P)H-flavin reductase
MTGLREVEARPEPMTPRPFTLVEKTWETPDTATLVFEDGEKSETPFAPGQFMMIYVFGIGEVPISIAGNPHMDRVLVHTVRGVGAVTNAIVALEPGDTVGMRGPYGTSFPISRASGRHLLVVAGGIGIAPLRPAILEALHQRDELKSLSLLYGARTPTDLLYRGDLLGWISTDGIHVEVTVDRAGSDWWGDVGLVTGLLPRVPFDPEATTAFICGPEVMMRVVARELRDRGVEADDIWISMERNMKCAVGLCGHCQYGSDFLCWGGPIGTFAHFADRMRLSDI